jgi:hypothetical protein
MKAQCLQLIRNAFRLPHIEEQKYRIDVYGETGILAMKQGPFAAVLISFFVASCYIAIPV